MKFRFSETPWAPESWFDGGRLENGEVIMSNETLVAIGRGGAWSSCLSSMIVAIAMGDKDIGPHVVLEGDPGWRW